MTDLNTPTKRDERGRFIKGHKHSKDICRKIANTLSGYKHTEETKRKVSEAGMGRKKSKESIASVSQENSVHWKGQEAGYSAIHLWINKYYGKADRCENRSCKGRSLRYEWANISGDYERSRDDFMRLCKSCHTIYDNGGKIWVDQR